MNDTRWKINRMSMSYEYLPWLATPVVNGVSRDARHFATWRDAANHVLKALAQ